MTWKTAFSQQSLPELFIMMLKKEHLGDSYDLIRI